MNFIIICYRNYMVISFRVCKPMDCHDNHRYHPYAPPADARQGILPGNGREWHRQDQKPLFLNGNRGGRNSRYASGRRGTGSMLRSMDREEMYHSSHRPGEGCLDPRYEGPLRRPSPPWYQGRSMNYGPPRPPNNYYYERNTRVHYREAGYRPPPRLHPKSMRLASTSPTGLVSCIIILKEHIGRAETHTIMFIILIFIGVFSPQGSHKLEKRIHFFINNDQRSFFIQVFLL